jgi:hypothetical protein
MSILQREKRLDDFAKALALIGNHSLHLADARALWYL